MSCTPPPTHSSPSLTVSGAWTRLFSWKSGSIQFSLPGEMTSSSYSLTLTLSLPNPLCSTYLAGPPPPHPIVYSCFISHFSTSQHLPFLFCYPLLSEVINILDWMMSDEETAENKPASTGVDSVNVQMCRCTRLESGQPCSTVVDSGCLRGKKIK